MRQIKFRGKRLDNGEWVYGDLLRNRGETFIAPDGIANPLATFEDFHVDPATVGQFTGLHDKNGKEIWEADIMADYFGRRLLCEWFRGGFWLNGGQQGSNYNIHLRYGDIEAISNTHDNPELLKTE